MAKRERDPTDYNYGYDGETKIYGDAETYLKKSYDRYVDSLDVGEKCNISEANDIFYAFEDGFNDVSKGGKGKMMKGGDLELINKVASIGKNIRDLLMPESTIAAIPDAETIFNDFKN